MRHEIDPGHRPIGRRSITVAAMIRRTLILAAVAMVAAPGSVIAEPYRPTDDQTVLERLPAPGDSIKRELRQLRTELSETPNDLDLAVRLARRYIERGRADSDPRYYGYAEAALAPWWKLAEPPTEVLVLRATVRQSKHEFEPAIADLSQTLAQDRRNPQAWLTRAVILRALGRFAEASDSCRKTGASASDIVQAACRGAVESLNGRAAESYDRLRATLSAADRVSPGVRLWALTNLAETAARLGNAEAAEEHFRAGLSLGVRNAYLLAAYADFLLDEGRANDARDLLAEDTRADALLLRLALAEERLNDPKAAEHIAALDARFAANRLRGGAVHLRAEARFTLRLLDRPQEALRLAQANWKLQREPWDSRLVLEAALAAGDPDAAAPVLDWIKKSRLEDVQIDALATQLTRGG